jgi:iron(II)-dependent oxidoreductase
MQQLGDPNEVGSFYIDRYCITNADYARFVNAGGYEKAEFWPQEILPWVLQFTDISGKPGPAFWHDGRPPVDRLDHPVVGVSWYEANAYARWAGKRLPSSIEWQRAGTWPRKHVGDGAEQRYPWGNSFESSKANLWQSGHGSTLPVKAYPEGNTPNGVQQLIGNVWEWTDAGYAPIEEEQVQLILEEVMAEIRGAAFDTYFPSQATCQFRSGQPTLHRGGNVGFRCCISAEDLLHPSASNGADPE